MLLKIIKYITIAVSSLCIIAGLCLSVAGLLESPVDFDAVWIGGAIALVYVGILVLLYFSTKRKYTPGYWVAFALSLLPIIGTLVFIWILIKVSDNVDM
ncbi:MAG: hypothetical protein QM731_24510 [Chitinophagaceae bacterium]